MIIFLGDTEENKSGSLFIETHSWSSYSSYGAAVLKPHI